MVIVGKEEFEEKKSDGGEDFEDFFNIAHYFFHFFKAERETGKNSRLSCKFQLPSRTVV